MHGSAINSLLEIVEGAGYLKKSASEWYFHFKRAVGNASHVAINQKDEWTWQTKQFLAHIRPELEEHLRSLGLSLEER